MVIIVRDKLKENSQQRAYRCVGNRLMITRVQVHKTFKTQTLDRKELDQGRWIEEGDNRYKKPGRQ